jgi:hypothetical protein
MSQFMLLLYDNPSAFANVTPEQMQQVIQEYNAWAGKLGQEGRLVGGEKLKDEGGKIIKQDGKQVKVTDGPYSETKEVIGGYFIIKADNYAQAVDISKTCPHVKYGPRIDVRQIDPTQ